MDFKVGDKVRVVTKTEIYEEINLYGKIGEIIEGTIEGLLLVSFEDMEWYFNLPDLELEDRIEDLARAFDEASLEEKSNIFVGNRETTLTIRIKDDTIILSESEAEQLLTELHNELRGA